MLQDEQFHIDRQLGSAALRCVTSDIKKFYLIAEKTQSGMSIALESDDNSDILSPSEDVFTAVRELFLLNDKYKTDLNGIKYTFEQKDNGKWGFVSDFSYQD